MFCTVKTPNPLAFNATPSEPTLSEKNIEFQRNLPFSIVVTPSLEKPSCDHDHIHRNVSRSDNYRQQNRTRHDHRIVDGQPSSAYLRTRGSPQYHCAKRAQALQTFGDVQKDIHPIFRDRCSVRRDSHARFPQRGYFASMNQTSFARSRQYTSARFNPSKRKQCRSVATVSDKLDYCNSECHTYRDSCNCSIRQAACSAGHCSQSMGNVHNCTNSCPLQSLKRLREKEKHLPRDVDASACGQTSLKNDSRQQELHTCPPSLFNCPQNESNFSFPDLLPAAKTHQSMKAGKPNHMVHPRSSECVVEPSAKKLKRVAPALVNESAPHPKALLLLQPMPTMEQMTAWGVSWPSPAKRISATNSVPVFSLPPPRYCSAVFLNGMLLPPIQRDLFVSGPQLANEKSTEPIEKSSTKISLCTNFLKPDSKHCQQNILIVKNIPSESLMVGPIFAYFQQFGIVADLVKSPPNSAFILFQNQDSAYAAQQCAKAVMGNRQISLAFARDSDFTEAGLIITHDGKLTKHARVSDHRNVFCEPASIESTEPSKKSTKTSLVDKNNYNLKKSLIQREGDQHLSKHVGAKGAVSLKNMSSGQSTGRSCIDSDVATKVLIKSCEGNVLLGKVQEEQKSKSLKRYQELVQAQKKILTQIENCTNNCKKSELMNKLRHMQEDALKVREEIKPSRCHVLGSDTKVVSSSRK